MGLSCWYIESMSDERDTKEEFDDSHRQSQWFIDVIVTYRKGSDQRQRVNDASEKR